MINKTNCSEYQTFLGYAFEHSKKLAEVHPEYFKACEKVIHKHPYLTSEKEALQVAQDMVNNRINNTVHIWAKIGKDEEYYYIQDYYIVTEDNDVKRAAEYIGMAHIAEF